jgi:hypothetical protein
MATIQSDNLPRPSSFDVRCTKKRTISAAGNFVFMRQPDAALSPRQFMFTYTQCPAPVIDAVRRHWDEHNAATFTVKLPISAEVVTVRYLSPPSIQWNSAVTASATVELEEALAHE